MVYHAVEDHIFAPARPGYAYRCRVAAFTVDQGPFTDYFIVTSQELGIPGRNFTTTCTTLIVKSPNNSFRLYDYRGKFGWRDYLHVHYVTVTGYMYAIFLTPSTHSSIYSSVCPTRERHGLLSHLQLLLSRLGPSSN